MWRIYPTLCVQTLRVKRPPPRRPGNNAAQRRNVYTFQELGRQLSMACPMRLSVIVVLCIGMGAVTTLPQQGDSDYAQFERPGRMVRLPPGNHLSLYCAGTKKPTIVLES